MSMIERESIQSVHPWTMAHGFYAGMGGFTFGVDSFCTSEGVPFIPNCDRLALTARGVALLARCGHLPNIHKEDIVDKSKADGLAKALACLQAGWMVVQVIGRVVFSLPVTLLEVNTLGHVLCALVIYLLWWHKPRLVHESTKLEGEWAKSLCAYMYMSSQISGKRSARAGILRRTWVDPELSDLVYFAPRATCQQDTAGQSPHIDIVEEQRTATQNAENNSHENLGAASLTVSETEDRSNSGYFNTRPQAPYSEGQAQIFKLLSRTEEAHTPRTQEMIRWRLAADAVRSYPVIRERFGTGTKMAVEDNADDWVQPITEELLTTSVSNWPNEDFLRGTGGLIMGMVLWFASMAFGAVHIAAWNDYFPSKVEALVWRLSAIYIASSGLLWLLINLLAHQFPAIDDYWERVLALRASRVSFVVLGSLCFICGAAYGFARIYLVIEAFISIRELPSGAYLTPDWTVVIPHL